MSAVATGDLTNCYPRVMARGSVVWWLALVAKGIGAVLLLVAGTVAVAWMAGIRVELSGGLRPMLTRFDAEANIDALEADRAYDSERAPVAAQADRRPESVWSSFRGDTRDGHYRFPIETNWPDEGLSPLWKQPIGGGYASFVAADGRLYTIEQRRELEVVAAYDADTGAELWTHGWNTRFQEAMGGNGPRATPTLDGDRLFALGANGELRSLAVADGRQHWRTNILEDADARNIQWAMSGSPLVVDGLVVVLPGGPDGRSVLAYDAESGEIVWTALDDVAGYAAPVLTDLAGERQILVVTSQRVAGLSVADGALLWDHPWVTNSGPPNISQPLIVGDSVFLSAGYGHGGARFDVSRIGGQLVATERWRTNRMKNRFASSVLHEGHIYGLDEGILAVLEAEAGELVWKGGRYGHGQLLLADGHLVILTERGELVLVRATSDEHQELARFDAIDGKTWNVPALVDGRLFLRNAAEMAAFDVRP